MSNKNYLKKAIQGMTLFICAFLAMGMGERFAKNAAAAPGEAMTATMAFEEDGVCTVMAAISLTNGVSCNGYSDGVLTASGLSATDSVTYLWSTGATTASISGLSAGTYTVTVTDTGETDCMDTDEYIVTEPAVLTATVSLVQNESETTGNDGSLMVAAGGGTPGYSYAWAGSADTSSTVSGLSAGTYTVTVTDANGCTATDEMEVIHLASLQGDIWLDLDQDQVFDDYESGIDDVEVRLFECSNDTLGAEVGSYTTSDEDGHYEFLDVLPGEYCVEVDAATAEGTYVASGYIVTTFSGMEDLVRESSPSIVLAPGEDDDENNIGIFYDACYPPYSLEATECTEDGATLSWQTINADEHDGVADHCWKVVVAGAGPQHAEFGELGIFLDFLGAGLHASLIELSICADDPALTVEAGDEPDTYKMTYVLSDDLIQPGTSYWFAVAEICDDMPSGGNNSIWSFQRILYGPMTPSDDYPFEEGDDPEYDWDDYEGYFETKDDQFLVDITVEKPTCPEESPGYEEDACIVVEITDGSTCWGTYNISIADTLMMQSDSEEGGTDVAGFGQGTYTFCGYGVGTYTVDVEEVEDCNPPKSIVTDDAVEVPNGMDMESPTIIVTDFFAGSLIADNVDESAATEDADLGSMDIPEGSCSMKSYFYVTGVDNCDGEVCEGTAVTATVTDGPENVDPGTQVTIYNLDGEVATESGVVVLQDRKSVV